MRRFSTASRLNSVSDEGPDKITQSGESKITMMNAGIRNLDLISDYKHIEKYRAGFNELAAGVFGIDFEPWYKAGFWNDRYICYSFADKDRIVSNVSINRMDLIINGEARKAIQIGTVMTHVEYRKKGLSKDLMNIVLGRHASECDLIYLFANESAYGFYPGFGFNEFQETSFSLSGSRFNMPGDHGIRPALYKNCPVLRKLDIDNDRDLEILKRLALKRAPVSEKLGVMNDSHLIMFYCLKFYKNHIYYIDDIDTALIYNIENDSLCLYDVLSETGAGYEMIMSVLAKAMNETASKKIVFMFTPDRFKLDIAGTKEERDYKLFVRPAGAGFSGKFVFPRLSHA